MGTTTTEPLTLPALFTWLDDHGTLDRPRLAVAVGPRMAAKVVRFARRLGQYPVVVTTPLELFWLLGDERVTVELVVGADELSTATGPELMRTVVEDWPDVCALVIDRARRPAARVARPLRTRRASRDRSRRRPEPAPPVDGHERCSATR